MKNVLSKAAYAKRVGCSKQYINEMERAGQVVLNQSNQVLVQETDDLILATSQSGSSKIVKRITELQSKVDVNSMSTEQLLAMKAALDMPSTPVQEVKSASQQLIEARVEKQLQDARIAKQKADQAAGLLIDRADANHALFEIVRALRVHIERLPERIAPELLNKTELLEVVEVLRREFHYALVDLADELERSEYFDEES